MRFRSLTPGCPEVGEIGVGAWQLGGPLKLDGRTDGHPEIGREAAIGLIRRCHDELGINFIDTAEQYGAGESERRVGEAIAGRRDEWVVCTKFGAQVGPAGERVNDVSAPRFPVSLEGSLRRLRTDHIDVYLYHTPPDPGEAEAVAGLLADAKAAGKIRACGISTNDLALCEFLLGLGCLDVVQFAANLVQPAGPMRAFLAANRLGGIVRGTFFGGRLSGRYFHSPPEFTPDDIRSNWFDRDSIVGEFARYAAFEELLKPGRPMPALAIRGVLDEPSTSTVILGAKSFDDYAAAARACDLPPLDPAERARVGEIAASLSDA